MLLPPNLQVFRSTNVAGSLQAVMTASGGQLLRPRIHATYMNTGDEPTAVSLNSK